MDVDKKKPFSSTSLATVSTSATTCYFYLSKTWMGRRKGDLMAEKDEIQVMATQNRFIE